MRQELKNISYCLFAISLSSCNFFTFVLARKPTSKRFLVKWFSSSLMRILTSSLLISEFLYQVTICGDINWLSKIIKVSNKVSYIKWMIRSLCCSNKLSWISFGTVHGQSSDILLHFIIKWFNQSVQKSQFLFTIFHFHDLRQKVSFQGWVQLQSSLNACKKFKSMYRKKFDYLAVLLIRKYGKFY